MAEQMARLGTLVLLLLSPVALHGYRPALAAARPS